MLSILNKRYLEDALENRGAMTGVMLPALLFGLLLAKQSSAYFFLLRPEPPETGEVRRYIAEHVPEQGRLYVEDFQPIVGGRLAYAESHALGRGVLLEVLRNCTKRVYGSTKL